MTAVESANESLTSVSSEVLAYQDRQRGRRQVVRFPINDQQVPTSPHIMDFANFPSEPVAKPLGLPYQLNSNPAMDGAAESRASSAFHSIEYDHRELNIAANTDPAGRNAMPMNYKSRMQRTRRFDSDDRIARFESVDTDTTEFRIEVKKLTSNRGAEQADWVKAETANMVAHGHHNKKRDPLAPMSTYCDNFPLSATSHPFHSSRLSKEKKDAKLTSSMPRIVPPQDVPSGEKWPSSTNYYSELNQPLLEERDHLSGEITSLTEANTTHDDISSWHNSARKWMCCC